MPIINGNIVPVNWQHGYVYDPIVTEDQAGRLRIRWPGWLDGVSGRHIVRNYPQLIERGGFKIDRVTATRMQSSGAHREEWAWVIQDTEAAQAVGMVNSFVSWDRFLSDLRAMSAGYSDMAESTAEWMPKEWPSLTLDGPRPPRLMSAEQEVAHGRSTLQHVLRDKGLLLDSSHHHHLPTDVHGTGQLAICYGMSDTSCDGEIVFSRLNLGDEQHANRYGEASAIVQAMAEQKQTSVSMMCGYHVHVSGTDKHGQVLTPNAIRRLYAIIGHVEPVLFRLAEGGTGRYRGGTHSQPIPKLANGQPRTAMAIQNHWRSDRYLSVNITPFLEAIQRCNCGAMTWNGWKGCTCGQVEQGGTIEFRVWNGVTRPDTIHAFLALSSAILDMSVRGRRLFDLPSTPVAEGTMRGGTLTNPEREAFKWLIEQLRLSDIEHAQIMALAERTSLAPAVTDTPPLPQSWQKYVATLKDQREYMRN